MDLKFYLNKILKIDNIEPYTLKTLSNFKNIYDKFLEETDGVDPEYLGMIFGGGKNGGKKVKGTNIYNLLKDDESVDDFRSRNNLGGGLGISNNKSNIGLTPEQARSITREQRKQQQKNNNK